MPGTVKDCSISFLSSVERHGTRGACICTSHHDVADRDGMHTHSLACDLCAVQLAEYDNGN